MAEIHKWYGFKELEQNLKLLGDEMHEKGVKRMMSRAAVPMRDDGSRRARSIVLKYPERREGTFADKIRLWRKRATQYAVTYYVGISRRKKDPFWWLFVELGIPSRGIPARSFLRTAFESKKMESVRVALEEGRKFIRKIRFKKTARPAGSWTAFVGERMGTYMQSEGGHAGAMRRISAEWQKHKQGL